MPQRRVRPAGAARGAGRPALARDAAGPGRDVRRPRPFAQSLLFCVDRRLHVRGRRARWPSGGPPPWRSTATCCATCSAPTSCATCSTPGAGRPRAAAPAPGRGPAGPRRRRGPRPAAHPRPPRRVELDARCEPQRPEPGSLRPATDATLPRTPVRGVGSPAGGRAAGHRGDHRRRGPLGGRRGRRPPARRARRGPARRAAGRLHRARARPAGRPGRPPRPHPRTLPDRPRRPPRYGVGADRVAPVLERLEADGRVVRGEFRPDGVEREWCDEDVLRQLRRRSLAALRKEVEPVEGPALARFLPEWHGVGRRRRGADALVEVLGDAPGRGRAGLGARVRRARRPARPYQPPSSTPSCAAGEVVWVGAGPSARPTVGCGCCSATRRACWCRCPATTGPRAPCTTPCAPTWPSGGPRSGPTWSPPPSRRRACDDATVLAALWDLVWAGEVTNDSLAPLRALAAGVASWPQPSSPAAARARAGAAVVGGPRARSAVAPTCGAAAPAACAAPARPGRRPVVAGGPAARARPRAHRGRPRPGPPAARAPRRAHPRGGAGRGRRGRLRRRLPGAEGAWRSGARSAAATSSPAWARAQFALPGAVDRLRARRASGDDLGDDEPPAPVVLAATDPAQPYGAALRGRPPRPAGRAVGRRRVVLVDGERVRLPRAGRPLAGGPARRGPAPPVGRRPGRAGGRRARAQLELTKIDGEPAAASAWADALRDAGFTDGYRGLTLRRR